MMKLARGDHGGSVCTGFNWRARNVAKQELENFWNRAAVDQVSHGIMRGPPATFITYKSLATQGAGFLLCTLVVGVGCNYEMEPSTILIATLDMTQNIKISLYELPQFYEENINIMYIF